MKPIINIADTKFEPTGNGDKFIAEFASLGKRIGA